MVTRIQASQSFALAALLLAPLLLVSSPAAAQTDVGLGWSAWVGCWEPVAGDPLAPAITTAPDPGSIVCVLPGDVTSVEIATVVDGSVVDRQRVAATGERVAVERDGCSGWESMEWSADGRRLYQTSEFNCGGSRLRESSGLYAMTSWGDWIDVRGIEVGEYTDVSLVRYSPVVDPSRLIPEVTQALEGRGMQLEVARNAAAARVDLNEVIDATRAVDAAVVEAWLIELNQGFGVDAARLTELARADVPASVIDLMVALSYPRVFAIDHVAREGEFLPEDRVAQAPPMSSRVGRGSIFDPWDRWYYGYDRGYYSDYNGRYYGRPVIIVRDGTGEAPPSTQEKPRLVDGRGYSRGGSSNPPAEPSSGSSGSSTSSQPSGTSDGSSAPAPATRTAKPRTE